MKESIAIIPARGGSKRIPEKNIRPFHGQPMIAYPIRVAIESKLFASVVVSTDSERIASLSRGLGAEVPFIRPENLSDDHTPTAPVLLHTIQQLRNMGKKVDFICCIYPTSPFITAEDLKKGYEIVASGKASGAFSVTSFPYTIFRSLKVNDKGNLEMFWPENEMTRSNDLPEAVHDAGQFYWLEVEAFLKHQKVWAPDAKPVYLPRHRVQDIDTLEDWKTAEMLYSISKGK